MLLLHIGNFDWHVDHGNDKDSPSGEWNLLAVQTKLLCTFLAVIAIALTPNGRWWTWLIYGIALLVVLWLSEVSISKLMKRMTIESAFISTILLGTLFRGGGEVLWSWGWMQITTGGLIVLGSVTLKVLLSLFILNILTLSTTVPLLLHGLVAIRTPPLLVAILASMYRYINVLVEEFNAMRRAAASRNFSDYNLWQNQGKHRAWQRQVFGNMIGMLFIRTYDRGDRIHQAMLARGYQGIPLVLETPQVGQRDLMALNLTVFVSLLGQAAYLRF